MNDTIKNFLVFLFILVLVAVASTAKAAEKKNPIDWTHKDVAQYAMMCVGKLAHDNHYDNAIEARHHISTKMASAMQILRNEGIIYQYDIAVGAINGSEFTVIISVLKEVDDEEMVIRFNFNNQELKKSKAVIRG